MGMIIFAMKIDCEMKKYYYITLMAAVATVCLQVGYVGVLYHRYVDEKIITIEDEVQKLSTREKIIRKALRRGEVPKEHPRIIHKYVSDMTPEEIDSLRRLPGGADTIDVVAAQKAGVGGTTGEIADQLEQDLLLKKGFPMNLNTLDSLWNATDALAHYPHRFLLYNEDSVVTAAAGNPDVSTPNYISKLYPIGTKGLQFLQVKADIPLSHFLKYQIGMLAASGCMMILVLFCLLLQLIVIRRKEEELRLRELTINGTIHDLKSPLNSVITQMGCLRPMMPDGETREMLEICQTGVKRMVSNIEALLMTARMDRQQLILNKSRIVLGEIVERVKKDMDGLYQDKPHTITIGDDVGDYPIDADSMYIENVLRNLVENSLKYSDDGVVVDIEFVVLADGRIRLTVTDNGWGIAPKYQKKLFRQFYRVPRTGKPERKGYGIGLAQSKCIIEAHGGEMKVESTEGKKSVFTFIIPSR